MLVNGIIVLFELEGRKFECTASLIRILNEWMFVIAIAIAIESPPMEASDFLLAWEKYSFLDLKVLAERQDCWLPNNKPPNRQLFAQSLLVPLRNNNNNHCDQQQR